jgi:hypothetical protein
MAQTGTTIQTFLLRKTRFQTAEAARRWLETQPGDLKTKLDEGETVWRARQREPGQFQKGAMRNGEDFATISVGPGVQAVVGILKPEFRS